MNTGELVQVIAYLTMMTVLTLVLTLYEIAVWLFVFFLLFLCGFVCSLQLEPGILA